MSPEGISGVCIAIIAGIVLIPAFQQVEWPEALASLASAFAVMP